MEHAMTDDDLVQALRRHRPVGPPGQLRHDALGLAIKFRLSPESERPVRPVRWRVWLPAAAGLAVAIGLGLSASRTHRAIAAPERQLLAAFHESDRQLSDPGDAVNSGARTEAERLLWLADVREAELAARQGGGFSSASR
jgi:hypothetical protein